MKQKILIRIGSLRHGGAEKVLVTFLKNLPSDKYEVDLLLNLNSGKYLKDVPEWINVLYLMKGEMITTNRPKDIPIKAFRVIFQKLLQLFPILLYKYILKNKVYDIEFAAIHGIAPDILNSPNKKSKKIVWIHNDLSNVNGYTEERLRHFFGFDKIMVISDKIHQMFLNLAISSEEKKKIVRIFNPIDVDEIKNLAKRTIDYKFDSSVKTFLSIGTVFPQKGFDRLLRVHRRLLDEGYPHKVLIVGDGYDYQAISELLKKLNLQDTATMVGYKENPYPYFVHSDYYILSSRYEGYPTVLFEAMVLQKPIVATDVSGVGEILNEGKLGYVIENNEEGIYLGMKRFLDQPQFAMDYVSIIDNEQLPFTLDNAVKRIEEILDSL